MALRYSGFPDTRRSGLLCEIMARLHNGGLSTAQLQVWSKGGNPTDQKVWKPQEWANFFDDIFGYKIDLAYYRFDHNNMVEFNIEHGADLMLLPRPEQLTTMQILNGWNAKVATEMVIPVRGNLDLLKDRVTNVYGYRSAVLYGAKSREEELKIVKMEPGEDGGHTLRGTLLYLMFLFWKYGTIDIFKDIPKTKTSKIKKCPRYLIPCGYTLYNEADADNLCFPFVVVEDMAHMYILPRGNKELVDKYLPGSVVGFLF